MRRATATPPSRSQATRGSCRHRFCVLLLQPVVGGAHHRRAQDLPRLVEMDHPLGGGAGALVEVRVRRLATGAVGAMNLLDGRARLDAEQLVQVMGAKDGAD